MKKKNNFWNNKKYLALAVLIVSGVSALWISVVRADPVIYYFNNAVNQSPLEQGNYWYDEALSNPALELPNFAVDHVTVSSGAVFAGDAVLRGNSFNYGEITGNAVFYDSAINDGLVTGNAEFFDNSICGGISGGTVVGNATFYEDSQATGLAQLQANAFFYDNSVDDGGTVGNDATFYGDLSENSGGKSGENNVSGIQTRYYTTATVTTRNFTLVGPWTVVADGVEVDLTGASFDGTTTFSAINGGSFIYPNGTSYYFNNAVNTSPTELGNYWTDADCTIAANQLPDFAFDEVFIVPTGFAFDQTIFDGNITFNGSAVNRGTVTGTAVFNDSSQNFFNGAWGSGQGIVQGTATFNDTSINSSTLESTSTFNDSSQNAADTGVVEANATFNDSAINNGQVTFSATFNDSAVNNGNILANATFNDSSQHASGQVVGDATFNGDLSEIPGRGGSVSGTQTRRYTTTITTTRNFVSGGPWTVLADGAIVDVVGTTYDGTTTFNTLNDGSFIFPLPALSTASATIKTITLTYNRALNSSSIPSANDFAISRNGLAATISNISISGTKVTILIAQETNFSLTDTVLLDYTPGINSIKSIVGAEAAPLNDTAVTVSTFIDLGGVISMSGTVAVGEKIYVMTGNSVYVVNSTNHAVLAVIPVGSSPVQLSVLGSRIYVPNVSSNNVSVIDTLTDTVIATISVGSSPFSATVSGTKIYITNSASNTVSVIDGLTNTVSGTISVGNGPRSATVVGNKVYINNYNGSSISVIDTLTDTVTSTIVTGSTPHGSSVIAYKLYVLAGSSLIKVIDTRSDTIIATINPGLGDLGMSSAIGNKLYVSLYQNNQIKVINSVSDTISSTIALGFSPQNTFVAQNKLIVGNNVNAGADFAIIDSDFDVVTDTISSQNGPQNFAVINSNLFVSNRNSTGLTVINLKNTPSQLPDLLSFSSTTASGTYTAGQAINITAHFARALHNSSSMTISLNSGASVVLNIVSGGTLSGTYTIASGESTPDLSVTAITDAAVSDLEGHSRTDYSLISSSDASDTNIVPVVRNLGDSHTIVIGDFASAATDSLPQQISLPVVVNGTEYLYVANKGDNTVTVLRKSNGSRVTAISVGNKPEGIATLSVNGVTYVYVANSASNTVSVINTSTNLVEHTISVGLRPSKLHVAASKLYVSNSGSNTVSVISPETNIVTATTSVGTSPRSMQSLGSNLYVVNYGDQNKGGGNFLSVINTSTDQVVDVVILPSTGAGAYGLATYNNKLFVTNYVLNRVWVINSDTKALEATISVSGGPREIIATQNGLYVSAFDAGTIWSINPNTYQERAIVISGHSVAGFSDAGTYIYYTRQQDNRVSAINISNNSVSDVFSAAIAVSGNGGFIPTPQNQNNQNNTPSEVETVIEDQGSDDSDVASVPVDKKLTERLKGRLLLAVGDHGKIWYLDPVSGQRYHVRLDNALTIFRRFALGITDANLAQVPIAPSASRITALANRLKGRILLQVEKMGFTWYVDTSGKRHLITVFTVLDVFKKLSLGITNDDLNKIEIGVFK